MLLKEKETDLGDINGKVESFEEKHKNDVETMNAREQLLANDRLRAKSSEIKSLKETLHPSVEGRHHGINGS